jgi:hypothetical protein
MEFKEFPKFGCLVCKYVYDLATLVVNPAKRNRNVIVVFFVNNKMQKFYANNTVAEKNEVVISDSIFQPW